jgi:membrane protease YdiL (CAAX protease family)
MASAAAQPLRRWAMILGVIFALGWPLVLGIFIPHGNLHDVRQDGFVLAAEWISVLVLFAIVTGWERQPFFSTSGWRAPKRTDWMLIAFFAFVAAALCVVIARHHNAVGVRGTILTQVYGVPLAMRAALVFTAGICEETLFRGYAIERLKLLTGNIWLGGLIATILFALAHWRRATASRPDCSVSPRSARSSRSSTSGAAISGPALRCTGSSTVFSCSSCRRWFRRTDGSHSCLHSRQSSSVPLGHG